MRSGKNRSDTGNAMVSSPQPGNKLGNREVKITRCPPHRDGKSQKKEKVKRAATEKEEKIVCWAINDKKD